MERFCWNLVFWIFREKKIEKVQIWAIFEKCSTQKNFKCPYIRGYWRYEKMSTLLFVDVYVLNSKLIFFRPRAHLRARCARVEIAQKRLKYDFLTFFATWRTCFGAQCARKCARAPLVRATEFIWSNRWLLTAWSPS